MTTISGMRSSMAAAIRRQMRRCAISALAICAVPGAAPPAEAATARADIMVSVTVVARTTLDSEASPAQLQVSAADVARGYVEVPAATRLLVTNTSRRGYLLSVWPQVQVFSAVVVTHGGYESQLGTDGGEIFDPRWGRAMPLVLSFRFMLAAGVKPGSYPWPLKFQVDPPGISASSE